MKIYDSIDTLPIWNYWQCINKKSLDFLIIEVPKSTPNETLQLKLEKAWSKIDDEMVSMRLKDKKYKMDLKKESIHYIRMATAAISGRTIDKLHLQISEEERKTTIQKSFDYSRSLADLEGHLGWQINDKTMSVSRYYAHWQRIIENSKRK